MRIEKCEDRWYSSRYGYWGVSMGMGVMGMGMGMVGIWVRYILVS